MYVELEDFKTGWYGISISIRKNEIDVLIEKLEQLKNLEDQHFHIRSDFKGEGGVADIEFGTQEEGADNMHVLGFAISPNR